MVNWIKDETILHYFHQISLFSTLYEVKKEASNEDSYDLIWILHEKGKQVQGNSEISQVNT
jgi:hypothetical protein